MTIREALENAKNKLQQLPSLQLQVFGSRDEFVLRASVINTLDHAIFQLADDERVAATHEQIRERRLKREEQERATRRRKRSKR